MTIMARKRATIKIGNSCMRLLSQLSLVYPPIHVSCPVFLRRRAISAVAQKMAAIKEVMVASVCIGNKKTNRIVGKALIAMICVKTRRLVRATVWIHFERSCFES